MPMRFATLQHRMIASLIVLFTLIGWSDGGGAVTEASSPVAEPAVVIPLNPYLGRLHTLEVEVAGQRLPFLFDTAGGATLLTPKVAAAAGCQPFGRGVGFRHDGQPLALQKCVGIELSIASPVLLAPHAAALLGLELSAEEPRVVPLPVTGLGIVEVGAREKPELIYDGLLNAAFLERYVVTLDLATMRGRARAAGTAEGGR